MAAILDSFGKDVAIVNATAPPANLTFLNPEGRIKKLDEDITRVWVLQYQTVTSFEPPTGFTSTATERYDSRFFAGAYRISLDRLERNAP